MSLTLLKITEEGKVVSTGISRIHHGELESCVYCGGFTAVTRDTPIDQREYYIKGVGQTHKECYELINGKRRELPFVIYEPTPLEILRKRGLRAFFADLFKGF